MIVLELFAATGSVSKAFKVRGHETYTVEWDKNFPDISLYADVSKLTAKQIINLCGGVPDVIWASPDCTTYSVAAISHHRRKAGNRLEPITEYAEFCDSTNRHVLDLINELKPRFYFIENPVGALRKMDFMRGLYRYTVTYCQYGETRQKPTDIWTNHPQPNFKPPCKRGAPCHEAAPKGGEGRNPRD